MSIKNNLGFKIVERTKDDCMHDTGVMHSTRLSCINVERMTRAYAMHADDPDHEAIWHNEKTNPNLITIEL